MTINAILDLKEPPIYENASCISAKIIDIAPLRKKGSLDKLIDSLIDEAVEEVSTKIETAWSFNRDYAIQKLRHFTSELVENVIEHAYRNSEIGAVSIYARVRSGKFYINDDIWEKQAKREIKECFLLDNWDEYKSNNKSKWIEVFIIDNGSGLLSRLNQWKTLEDDAQLLLESIDSKTNKPLKTIGHKIFSGGYSKSNRPKTKTRMTGLQLIHEILKRKASQDYAPGEYVRLLTGNEVIAGHLPFDISQARGRVYKVLPDELPNGTFFHTCIEISDDDVVLPETFSPVPKEKLEQIRESVLEHKKTEKLDLFTVDQRYLRVKGDNYDAHRRPTDVLNHKKTGLSNGEGISRHSEKGLNNLLIKNGTNHLVWLPPDSVTKIDIKAWIDFTIHSSLASITIADIPLHRARIFEYIVSTEEIKSFSRKNNFYIYIITRNWYVAAYKAEVSGETYRFILQHNDVASRLGLDKLNSKLRENDSSIFWANVLTRTNSSFVKEPVTWIKASTGSYGREHISGMDIQGYLDFSESISNKENFKIIKAALERITTLWRNQGVLLLGIDDLIRPFSGDINIIHDLKYIYGENKEITFKQILLIGSTLVSGETSERIKSLIRGIYPSVTIDEIFILHHPSRKRVNTPRSKVLNWSEDIVIKKTRGKKYERLEGTPYIKRGGTKSYRIDRNDNPSTPYIMYRDFTQGHLKLGHWEYDNSHDLLTPNLSRIISTNPEIVSWYNKTITDLFSENCINDKKVKNILIYISHVVTNKLINLLLDNNPEVSKWYEIHSLQKLNLGASQHFFSRQSSLKK